MINLGELITQISGALLTLTDDLCSAFAKCYDRTHLAHNNTHATTMSTTSNLLQHCRDEILAAHTAAHIFCVEPPRV